MLIKNVVFHAGIKEKNKMIKLQKSNFVIHQQTKQDWHLVLPICLFLLQH